ncbi:MAG: hypothetical protein GY731_05670 [Gammaproteobacteria bacterium]|nr:hypothetical protein [Gammaproteobacteria bacterium]
MASNGSITTLLVAAGAIIFLAGWIYLVVIAFKESPIWGLAILLIPLAWLIYIPMRWKMAWKPFLALVVGFALLGAG